MILAEKIRADEEKRVVLDALEDVMRVKLNVEAIYEACFETVRKQVIDAFTQDTDQEVVKLMNSVVWTGAMKRLFSLVFNCIQHNEPVLLVGETGCGKTTVCQVILID